MITIYVLSLILKSPHQIVTEINKYISIVVKSYLFIRRLIFCYRRYDYCPFSTLKFKEHLLYTTHDVYYTPCDTIHMV